MKNVPIFHHLPAWSKFLLCLCLLFDCQALAGLRSYVTSWHLPSRNGEGIFIMVSPSMEADAEHAEPTALPDGRAVILCDTFLVSGLYDAHTLELIWEYDGLYFDPWEICLSDDGRSLMTVRDYAASRSDTCLWIYDEGTMVGEYTRGELLRHLDFYFCLRPEYQWSMAYHAWPYDMYASENTFHVQTAPRALWLAAQEFQFGLSDHLQFDVQTGAIRSHQNDPFKLNRASLILLLALASLMVFSIWLLVSIGLSRRRRRAG